MKESSQEYKVSYYRSTHPCTMTLSFLLIAFVVFFIADNHHIPPDEKWMVHCAIGIFILGAGFYAIKWIHSIRFTSEEIVFYRLGFVYRRILWTDIIQTGLAKEYKADKLTLVLTPSNCPKYDDSQYITTTHYVEKHRWKLILLDATKNNKAAVQQFYGELEYEAPHRK